MTNAIENNVDNETTNETTDDKTERATLVVNNFTLLPYEIEKYTQAGWAVDEQAYPTFDFVNFEVHLYRNRKTIARAKLRLTGGEEGKPVLTKGMRQESMRKAREKLAVERAEAKKVEGNA